MIQIKQASIKQGSGGNQGYEDEAIMMARPSPRENPFTPKRGGGVTPRGDNEGNKTPKSIKDIKQKQIDSVTPKKLAGVTPGKTPTKH